MPYYPPGNGGAADGVNLVSAGTQIAGTNATVVFSNANNVSFGMNNSSVVTASASVAAGAGDGVNILAAGTQTANTSGTVSFANSNGISFGLSNSSIMTATVKTDYQSSNANYLTSQSNQAFSAGGGSSAFQTLNFNDANGISFTNTNGSIGATVKTDYQTSGAYLTTAMQSASSSVFAKTGFTSASTAGTDIVGTLNTNGLSVGIPKYLTTAQPTGAYLTTARASNDAVGLNTAKTNATWTVNSSGISLDAGAYLTTAQPVGAYLTTARASNDAIGLNTAKTNVTWTVNSSGLSLDAGAYLTTAMASNRGTDFVQANAAFAGTNASGTIASNGISVSVAAPGGGGGPTLKGSGTYTQSTGTVEFANSNGITFGLSNNGTMTASHNGLTTAMASNRGTDFVQANAVFNGTNASGTIASNAISVSVAAPAAGVGIAAGTRTATTAGNLLFDTGNGITFGLNAVGGSIMTASHNAITTARASTDAIGLNTAQTNVTWTANSSGLSLNASGYAGTATATTGNISVTLNSAGLSLNAPAFLTTAAQSSASNISGVVAATASNAATNQTAQLSGAISFSNTNGVSFYTTASGAVSGIGATVATNYQSQGAYLTTARASTDAVGLNTAATNVTWTVNSSGISLNAGAYLTTAAASNHSHGNPTLALTNLSGTTASASNGLTLSLSAAAAGGVNPAASASNGSFAFTTLNFSNANNVTFGSSVGGIITASVAAPGAAAENNWVNLLGANTAGNTTASGSTLGMSGINLTLSGTNGSAINISAPATSSLSGTGQVSLSTNGSTISIGVPGPVTVSRYNEFKESPLVAGNIGQGSLHMQPWLIPNLQFDRVVVHKAFSNATNSSGSFTVSDWVGIYTQNASTLSLLYSTSNTTNFSGSGTVGSYLSYGGGIKAITMGLTQTLTEGMYWIGVINRTTTGGVAGHTLDQALNSNLNSSYRGLMGVATNATNQMSLGFGAYTATTAGLPNSVAFTQINGNSSVYLRPPSLYFMSGTI